MEIFKIDFFFQIVTTLMLVKRDLGPLCIFPTSFSHRVACVRGGGCQLSMNIMLLKTKISQSTHGTQLDQIQNAPLKVQKLTEPTRGVAWT